MKRPTFTIVTHCNHWKIADGAYWRRAVIRTAAGDLRYAYVFDGECAVAA